MYSKRLSAVLCILLLLLIAGSASAGTIQLDIPAGQTLGIGETGTWNLTLSDADNLTACTLHLSVSGTGSGTLRITEASGPDAITPAPEFNSAAGMLTWTSASPVRSGTIAQISYTPDQAGSITISVTPVTLTELAAAGEGEYRDVTGTYTVRGGTLSATGDKSLRLLTPPSPLNPGSSAEIPLYLDGSNNLTAFTLIVKTSDAGKSALRITKGASLPGDLSIGAFSPSGEAVITWTSASPVKDRSVHAATIICTPSSPGNIPVSVTPQSISELGSPETGEEYHDVTGLYLPVNGIIPVAGSGTAVVEIKTSGAVPLNRDTLIPVNVTGANNLLAATFEIRVDAAGAGGVISLVTGPGVVGSASVNDIGNIAGDPYLGRVSWTSASPVSEGTLFYVRVHPTKAAEIPVSLTITEAKELGTAGGDEYIDALPQYTAKGAVILSSFINKLKDNTVPPEGGFVAGDGLWSATTPVRVVYNASSEERNMAPPKITWGAKSIPVNETLIVEQTAGGGLWSDVFRGVPVMDAAGNVTIPAATQADAIELRITFEGRKLGDVNGDGRITISDSQKIMEYRIAAIDLNIFERFYADVSADGRVTVSDSQKVMDYRIANVNEHYT